MSEKHGQIGAQWTKSTAVAGSAATTAAPLQKHTIFEAAAAATSPYGSCGIPGLHTADVPYASGRFQAPTIHNTAPLSITPTTAAPGIHAPPQVSPTIPTNVPASSGFVPPPFPNANVSAAAATSVLTPNPFAAAAAAAAGGNAGMAFVNAFGFNTAHQLELGKIMNAMNAAGAGGMAPIAATTSAAAAGPQMLGSPASLQRHHSENAAGGSAPAVTASGVINSTIAENVMSALTSSPAPLAASGKVADEEKMRRVQQVIEGSLDDNAKLQISDILERVGNLKPIEKLFLYLRLPGENADTDPLRQPQNPLGTRSEINHTINWVRSHLEHDPQVSIPKQDVYNDYITYCERLSIKPLSTADFGKVMKQVFPGVRPRRLGTRGNSRYCYAAMRKTTKLTPPQLPRLCKSDAAAVDEAEDSAEFKDSSLVGLELESEPWTIVRSWAEKLLNVKLDGVKDLAARIQSNNATVSNLANNASATGRMGPKKYTPREPKEKRMLTDMGPLKKRRKKKRKGSTSSESSQVQDATSSQEATAYQAAAAIDEDQKSEKLVKIKQEIIDSPIQQQTQATHVILNAAPVAQQALHSNSYMAPQQQQQIMPMNLATEQRSVLSKLSPHSVQNLQARGVARNLTPKILELTSASVALSLEQLQTSGVEQQQQASPTAVIIKDEVDDYNTTNIFCKKVLKAQQTKGFWVNSPSGASSSGGSLLVPPVITTTAATPPPPTQLLPPNATLIVPGSSPVPTGTQLSMGPPAQLNHSTTSMSPSGSLDVTPKVASRNMALLRAKRLMAAESAAAAEDTCLPENLGLPRERVISICNMDKHELDDYFLAGEEENSEGPDTELLQYFPMGDAEEKQLNSLDAAEQYRNPQATPVAGITALATKAIAETTASMAGGKATMAQQQALVRRAGNMPSPNVATLLPQANNATKTSNVVGSASASLALMSRKHQHQQQQQQRQKLLPSVRATSAQARNAAVPNSNSNKRKISLSNASSNGNNRNCIFLPISPNINSSTAAGENGNSSSSHSTNNGSHLGAQNNSNCFASPGVTRMRHRSYMLTKQQSLDFDSCSSADGSGDPMIGAHRRRRNYVYSYPTSSSASAPPSPSLQQQYLGPNWSLSMPQQQNNNSGSDHAASNFTELNVALLDEQNSMDLETSLALDSSGMGFQLTPLSETQRSQSVPLSQLQRTQSPTFNRQLNNASFQPMSDTRYSSVNAINSVCDALLSENSNSAQSAAATLKLNDVNDVAAAELSYEVDVSALISPSFSNKFNSNAQQQTQPMSTTCSSSAGSTSGYSSGGSQAANSFGGGIVSRSVPSTPLPHQQLQHFGSGSGAASALNDGNSSGVGGFLNRRNDDFSVSPELSWSPAGGNVPYGHTHYSGTRNALDISKSMPSTPITTPCFRYSPTELPRDFLINGNTIDSLPTSAFADSLDTDVVEAIGIFDNL